FLPTQAPPSGHRPPVRPAATTLQLLMHYLPQLLFVILLAAMGYLIFRRVSRIRGNILMGRPEDRSDRPAERWRAMALFSLGQKKMFKKPLVAVMHFLLYAAFIIINLEVLEIILDGIFGTHRLFFPYLGAAYGPIINFFELLALGVIIVCVVFLVRRNVKGVGPKRLHADFHREMRGWPSLDGNLILVFEILLMMAFLTMNASDVALQNRGWGHYAEAQTGGFLISRFLVPLFEGWESTAALVAYERAAWWIHITGILAFALYVTYSKHLHIGLAFPNTYYQRLVPKGEMKNMDRVTQEVKLMLGLPVETPQNGNGAESNGAAAEAEIPRFGAKDVPDLTWKQIMEAYTCTECGRCTDACPANLTGKKLSPRKIMQDVRDRAEEIGELRAKGETDDGKSLLGDYTTKEELMACTTCNACVEACPVQINPLDIILEQRRYVAMEEAQTPASWNAMFQNVENNFAPWAFPASDRFAWADALKEEPKNRDAAS
ncbi:MAG: 4Fe-4S dicluster domain-containing protein, partial [Catalinimonas sp.]